VSFGKARGVNQEKVMNQKRIQMTTVRGTAVKNFFTYLVRFFMFFALAGMFVGCADGPAIIKRPRPVTVTILFFNDLHGHLSPFKVKTPDGSREVGGIARVATAIGKVREENEIKGIKTVVLVAGDILQGTPMSTVYKGEPDIAVLNLIGVDAMTVGNHEFDFGLENFLKLKSAARFPFLSANIFWKDSERLLCEPSKTIELTRGLSLSVLGVTTEQLMVTTLPANVEALSVQDPVDAISALYKEAILKGPVLLLSHSRHQTDRNIAEACPKLAAIIGGHDQILLDPYRQVGKVPIFEAFEKGRYLGRADMEIDRETFEATLVGWGYIPITDQIVPDQKISEEVNEYQLKLDEQFKAVIGQATVFLDAERERIRYEETNLGDWVTDIMRAHTGADIALLNSGSLRASIADGPVTIADVFRAMPYENVLVTTEITGRELLAILDRSVKGTREEEDGGFLQVSGIRFIVSAGKPENVRVGSSTEPLDIEKNYTLAITDFMAAGGDGYAWFKAKTTDNTQLPLRELIIDTLRSQKVVGPVSQGRIVRIAP
jgi:5'-nucleotidase / UDP-sugar diphosphatase